MVRPFKYVSTVYVWFYRLRMVLPFTYGATVYVWCDRLSLVRPVMKKSWRPGFADITSTFFQVSDQIIDIKQRKANQYFQSVRFTRVIWHRLFFGYLSQKVIFGPFSRGKVPKIANQRTQPISSCIWVVYQETQDNISHVSGTIRPKKVCGSTNGTTVSRVGRSVENRI